MPLVAQTLICAAEGKNLATEAHRVRLQAVAAHGQAAQQIEHANNTGRGLGQFELDLHGLHATEAVDALDRRQASDMAMHTTSAHSCYVPAFHPHSFILSTVCNV